MRFGHGAWMMRHCQPFFDADGGGGAGGSTSSGEQSGAGGSEGDGGGKQQPFAVFDDEKSFMTRVSREGKKQADDMAKKLGFDSLEKMQDAAKAKMDQDLQNQTDLEKAQAAQREAEKKATDALKTANLRAINAEIKIMAIGVNFVDPGDAVALIDRSGIQIDDSGNVTGVKEAIEVLAKAKPHLVGQGKPGGSPGSAGNGGRQDGQGMTDVERAKKLADDRNKGTQAVNGGYDPWAKK